MVEQTGFTRAKLKSLANYLELNQGFGYCVLGLLIWIIDGVTVLSGGKGM